jgi:beta-galactosidase
MEKVTVDVLDPHRDLKKYNVVFAPNIYIVNSEIVDNLKSYIRNGGFLITGLKTALKNWSNVFYTDIPPCQGLSEVFGTTVKPDHLTSNQPCPKMKIRVLKEAPFAGCMSFANEGLVESLEPTTAKTIAVYQNGDAAITLNKYEEGSAMYLGCEPEEGFYLNLIRWLISIGKAEPVLKTDADVEATMRAGDGYKLIFILNHNHQPAEVALDKEYHELISDKPISRLLVIEGYGVKILSEKTK